MNVQLDATPRHGLDLRKTQQTFKNMKVVNQSGKTQTSTITPGTSLITSLSAKGTDDEKNDEPVLLHSYIPQIQQHFILDGKIGEGTFSHVYKARLKASNNLKKEFAVKFLIPTSHPSRIANELKCLRDIGGCCNVMDIQTCFLHKGHVAIVMPYFPHERFSEYVDKLTAADIQEYIKNLLIALERVHSFNIIHRDVKPSNFLYNRELRKYALVDFGLAQRLDDAVTNKDGSFNAKPSQIPLVPPVARKRLRTFNQENQCSTPKRPCLPGFPVISPLQASAVQNVPPAGLMGPGTKRLAVTLTKAAAAKQLSLLASPRPREVPRRGKTKLCCCFGRNEVCNICLGRAAEVAPRAGTPGFRAPEVLMKYRNQTTAIDVWSAGVILLSLLSGRYPFFRAQDDLTALAEIITIMGSSSVQDAAQKMGKRLTLSHQKPALDLKTLCEKLRGVGHLEAKAQQREGIPTWATALTSGQLPFNPPDSVYDLLRRLLDPNPFTRITATEALEHTFIKDAL